jgi:hypothetical protein
MAGSLQRGFAAQGRYGDITAFKSFARIRRHARKESRHVRKYDLRGIRPGGPDMQIEDVRAIAADIRAR